MKFDRAPQFHRERDKLVGNWGFGPRLMMKSAFIHEEASPLNELYWTFYQNLNDKAINMDKLYYLRYDEYSNWNFKPFKKD